MRQRFVGRVRELEALGDLEPRDGHGAAVLVSGEAGIGKSSLVQTFADAVTGAGGQVAVGRASSIGGPPFWLWQQVLEALGMTGQMPWSGRGGEAREFVFPDVVHALRTQAGSAATVVVLEDVQWADEASLALLRFVVEAIPQLPVLVVMTVREPVDTATLTGLLVELPTHVLRLPLTGIDAIEAGVIVRELLGRHVDDAAVAMIHQRTGGNPFFVSEIARLQALQGPRAGASVPDGVRQVLGRRLARVHQQTNAVLAAAALCDRLDGLVLAEVCELEVEAVEAALDEALRARLIVRTNGRLAFAHALVREVLEDDVGARVPTLHRRIALALERRDEHQHERLALHWSRAEGEDASERAGAHALAAARRAVDAMAYEQAVTLYDLAVASRYPLDDGILVEVGEARILAGDLPAGRDLLRRAARSALAAGHPELAGRAVLALGGGLGGFEVDLGDQEQGPLLRSVLVDLDAGSSSVRASLLARLSLAEARTATLDERIDLATAAVEMARESGDAAVRCSTLAAYCDAVAGPDHVHDRLDASTQMVDLAASAGDARLLLLARRLRLVALLELGRLTDADREIAAYADTVSGLQAPLYAWPVPVWRGMRALLDGDEAGALAFADEAERLATEASSPNAHDMVFTLRMAVLLERGDARDALPALDAEAEHVVGWVGAECAFAGMYAMAGRLDQARTFLDRRMAAGLEVVPKDSEWVEFLWHLAVAAQVLDDGPAMRTLVEWLTPYADIWAVDGIGGAVFGVVAHLLGLLEGRLGDLVAARRWLDRALTAHRDAGAAGLVAATSTAIAELGVDTGVVASLGDDPTSGTFLREGPGWRVVWREHTAVVTHSKGMGDLARLLSSPGTAFDTMELMRDGVAPVLAVAAVGDAGPAIDAEAKRAYRQRLADLDREIDEADADADLERAAIYRTERDFLLAELSSSLGLGGRARRVGDPRERARKAVGMRLRTALQSIETAHPSLGRHLTRSVSTGRFCSYQPEQAVTWVTSA